MKASTALRYLRERRYLVYLDHGQLVVHEPAEGLTPEKRRTALAWIRAHHRELREALRYEQDVLSTHPEVLEAAEILRARVLAVRAPGEENEV